LPHGVLSRFQRGAPFLRDKVPLVLTVLAVQFRRVRLAVVLASVPAAIVGAPVALLVTGTALNASSLMGCVLLVGLVVKNGVLLLGEAERVADAGADAVDAVARASDRRLRPVLMTTLATLAGLLPFAARALRRGRG
jgi:multidrug efflux pump subunit AcrB